MINQGINLSKLNSLEFGGTEHFSMKTIVCVLIGKFILMPFIGMISTFALKYILEYCHKGMYMLKC